MADLFTHEQRRSTGELPKYYVHKCHPTIIDRDTFRRVQEELARRSALRKTSSKTKTELGKYCGEKVLSELLVSAECGSPYHGVVWSRPEGNESYGAASTVWSMAGQYVSIPTHGTSPTCTPP